MDQSITFDKPFKTYDELVELMQSRHIIINNRDFAIRTLSSLSYYTIVNGYKNTFLSIAGSDDFIEGTTFENLYTLHIIDTNLNSIILKNILFIERYLKTRISYLISKNYGVYTDKNDLTNTNPIDYLFRDNYNGNANSRNNVLKGIKKVLLSDHLNPSVAHYANDKNHIPPWILVTALSLGLTIKWYDILTPGDKASIALHFIDSDELNIDEKKEFLIKALTLLRQFRNQIAHGNRTFSIYNLPVLPKKGLLTLSLQSLSEAEYNQGIGKNDLFAIVLICFILIDDEYILTNLYNDLIYVLRPYESIQMNGKSVFEIFNLPNNIFERLHSLLINRFTH